MTLQQRQAGVATIANGQTQSNWIPRASFGDASAIGILTPSGNTAGTCTIQVATEDEATVATLQSGDTPADLNTPAPGKARAYMELPVFSKFRIVSGAPVTGAQTWNIFAQ